MIPARIVWLAFLPLPLLAACKEEAPAPPPVRPVLTMTVMPVTMEMFGPFASVVEARYQTQLGFQLSGRMVARDVYVGDVVRKGRRLAALDPTVTQFALNRAKADVADAKAQLVNAKGIEQRQRALAAGGNASQATLDNAVAGLATANARVDQTQAALRMAEDQMGYTELRANFDGVITAWTAEVGQYVTNGQAVVTVARPDVREAVVDIADDMMINVRPGMVFTVRLLVAPNITTKAVVREIGPLADAATRSHRVRLTLQDAMDAFRIGTTITVAVERPVAPRLFVPSTAVVTKGDARFVWCLTTDGRRVTRRQVTVTAMAGDKLLIGTGLAPGDRVVTVGVNSLEEGQQVAGTVDDVGNSAKVRGTRL
jgi:RND family efflux transporter MFP subunit